MTILGVTSIGALVGAIQTGQFHSIGDGAESIFDADEPIASVTDKFPVSAVSKKASKSRKAAEL